jgi:glycosyltransferase involved in cell wall biosynthesis
MKVAIYLRSMESARGAEQAAAALAGGLARRGHDVTFLVEERAGFLLDDLAAGEPPVRVVDLHDAPVSALADRVLRLRALLRALVAPGALRRAGTAWVAPTFRLVWGDEPPLAAIRGFVERERPDAFVAQLNYPNLVALLAKPYCRVPTRFVVTVQNHLSTAAANTKSRWVRAVPLLVKRFFGEADAIVAASRGVAEDIASLAGARAPISVIHNPGFRPEIEALAAPPAGDPWLDAPGPPVVLAVGKLKPQKDFPTLLRAFRALREKRPARLVILGEGDGLESLEALARELGVAEDVRFAGFVRNPYPHYARASVFALSSIFEGFANVVSEALACGCPVVATDCPSGPAEILDGGRFGRLVPVRDADALATALAETLDAPPPRERLRERARAFSLDAVLDQWEALLGAGAAPKSGSSAASISSRH